MLVHSRWGEMEHGASHFASFSSSKPFLFLFFCVREFPADAIFLNFVFCLSFPHFPTLRSAHKKTRWVYNEQTKGWRYFNCMFFFCLSFYLVLYFLKSVGTEVFGCELMITLFVHITQPTLKRSVTGKHELPKYLAVQPFTPSPQFLSELLFGCL